jgi:putative NADH-flavin reductase
VRILLLGANGHTGSQVIDLALGRFHEVTAFVRSPQKITRPHPRLKVVRGDPRAVEQLAEAVPGHDAVISALGVRPPLAFRPHTLVQDCAASTIEAMQRTGVNRLVLVSAAVLFPGHGAFFTFFRWLLTYIRRDLGAAEEIVRAASLDWTIARPPRLTAGSEERYRTERDALPSAGYSLSFRALAAFLLDAVERHNYVRETVGLASAIAS